MVFIYGGGFEIGSAYSYTYGPDYFLDEDIVLVTLNYRLGVLGESNMFKTIIISKHLICSSSTSKMYMVENVIAYSEIM